jgi:hypothetical protein
VTDDDRSGLDEDRLAAAWAAIDSYEQDELRALIDGIVADAPPAVADFERASAWDSTAPGPSRAAVPVGARGRADRAAPAAGDDPAGQLAA